MRGRFISLCAALLLGSSAGAIAIAQAQEPTAELEVESVVAAAEALLATVQGEPDVLAEPAAPGAGTRRPVGLPLKLMSAAQRMLVHDLLLSVLSSKWN